LRFVRYKTCLALDDVPIRRVYDDAFWAFLFKLVVYQAKQNTPEKIYDYLLPYVTSRHLCLSLIQAHTLFSNLGS
jgi:hypothetical protein